MRRDGKGSRSGAIGESARVERKTYGIHPSNSTKDEIAYPTCEALEEKRNQSVEQIDMKEIPSGAIYTREFGCEIVEGCSKSIG